MTSKREEREAREAADLEQLASEWKAAHSYAAEVIADSSGKWVGNGLRFATALEAAGYALNLADRWMMVTDTRVVESEDPVNYRYEDGKLARIEEVV
jgi:hypothetical protein